MSVRDSKEVVRDFLSAARQGDRTSMADLLHPQVEIHEAGSLPFAGVHRGLEGFQALTRQVFARFMDTQISVERLFAQGDTVVVEMRLSYAELLRQSQARATLKAPMTPARAHLPVQKDRGRPRPSAIIFLAISLLIGPMRRSLASRQ